MMRKKGQSKFKRADKPKVDWKALEVVHPHAAGIDIGGHEHWVAISPEKDEESVRCFDCFTADVEQMADWLVDRGVRSVAMQSTGVYWMPVFEILQQHGLEVFLVNARHTKNLPGRKSDIAECQWLLKLHTFGLLNNSFQPSDEIRTARTLWRHRGGLVAQAGSAIQRMQKALIEMNIQLSSALTDLSGVSGMAILQAILDGERDPRKLAALADPHVKASKAVIAKSLQGNWRPELVFVLRQEVEAYRSCQDRIAACDRQLQPHLQGMAPKVDLQAQPLGPRPKGKRAGARQRSQIRPAERTVSHHRRGLVTGEWHRRASGAKRDCRGGGGSERLSQRKAFRQLAGIVPHQRNQWRQSTEAADPQSGQPGQGGIPAGGFQLDPQPKLSGRAIPPVAYPTGRAEGHHRDGPQAILPVLPAPQVWAAIRR
jgi:transposase